MGMTMSSDSLVCIREPRNQIKIMLDDFALPPVRAHKEDAGLDLRAPADAIVPAKGNATFDTGVHVEIPRGYVGLLMSKSGLNVKHDITSEGVIDCGYVGSIVVKLYNHGDKDYQVKRGDKISQLILMPIITPELILVSELEETERGSNGFGSTGK